MAVRGSRGGSACEAPPSGGALPARSEVPVLDLPLLDDEADPPDPLRGTEGDPADGEVVREELRPLLGHPDGEPEGSPPVPGRGPERTDHLRARLAVSEDGDLALVPEREAERSGLGMPAEEEGGRARATGLDRDQGRLEAVRVGDRVPVEDAVGTVELEEDSVGSRLLVGAPFPTVELGPEAKSPPGAGVDARGARELLAEREQSRVRAERTPDAVEDPESLPREACTGVGPGDLRRTVPPGRPQLPETVDERLVEPLDLREAPLEGPLRVGRPRRRRAPPRDDAEGPAEVEQGRVLPAQLSLDLRQLEESRGVLRALGQREATALDRRLPLSVPSLLPRPLEEPVGRRRVPGVGLMEGDDPLLESSHEFLERLDPGTPRLLHEGRDEALERIGARAREGRLEELGVEGPVGPLRPVVLEVEEEVDEGPGEAPEPRGPLAPAHEGDDLLQGGRPRLEGSGRLEESGPGNQVRLDPPVRMDARSLEVDRRPLLDPLGCRLAGRPREERPGPLAEERAPQHRERLRLPERVERRDVGPARGVEAGGRGRTGGLELLVLPFGAVDPQGERRRIS